MAHIARTWQTAVYLRRRRFTLQKFRGPDVVLLRPQALDSIRAYAMNSGGGMDGNHVVMAGWFWWCWNADSGDTGGMVSVSTHSTLRSIVNDWLPIIQALCTMEIVVSHSFWRIYLY